MSERLSRPSPSSAIAFPIDMCASLEAYTMPGRAPASFAGKRVSRAIASPIRFAIEPPPHRLPVKPAPPSAASRSALKSVIRAARDLNSATDRCRAFIGQPKLSRRVPGYYTRRWFMMYRAMIDPAIGALLAGAFALLFIGAALQKLRSPERFAELFRAYRVVPDGVARLSWLVPVLELTTGAGLLAGGSRAGACAVGAALLLSYAAAMALKLQRGSRGPA